MYPETKFLRSVSGIHQDCKRNYDINKELNVFPISNIIIEYRTKRKDQ